MNFFNQQIQKALVKFAFPLVDKFDEYQTLPYQEPRFRFIQPDEKISSLHGNGDVFVSKKPEGEREIFIGVYDRVAGCLHFFSVNRRKEITYIPSQTIIPCNISSELQKRIQDSGSLTPFVFDVCRVLDIRTRSAINVLLSDIGPIKLDHIKIEDFQLLTSMYHIVRKFTKKYTSLADIDEVVSISENFPYHPENGIIFVQECEQTKTIHPKSPCAKYTPPQHASVYFFVEPIITLKTHLWKLMYLGNQEFTVFKTIPSVPGFFIPPTGAVVSFGIHSNPETKYWKFFPKHIRLDKTTPSVLHTIQQFLGRYTEKKKTENVNTNVKNTNANTNVNANANAFEDDADETL
jgi:hypothetical protein